MATIVYDARNLKAFGVVLRETAPKLQKSLRSAIGKVGRVAATKIRADVPHKDSTGDWGTLKGVRYSDSVSSKGGAILIDHLAYTFGIGQPTRPGRYKHKVYGKWSSSSKTIMDISDFVDKDWAEIGPALKIAADAVIEEILEEWSFGDRA